MTWTDCALADLEHLREYIERDNPGAAREQALRVVEAAAALARHPDMGRPGRVKGTRELVVPGTPYILPYRVGPERIEILRVLHGARRWPKRF